MAVQRVSLKEAGELLNVSTDTVRHRFRNGDINGSRDNAGKIWVEIDTETAPGRKGNSGRKSRDFILVNPPISKLDSNMEIGLEIRMLNDHVQTLKEELSAARAERDKYAALADQLPREQARVAGLEAETAALRERLASMQIEREQDREDVSAQIDDLRMRLDTADQWGKAKDAQLTAILTDQRAKEPDPAPAAPVLAPASVPPAKGLRGLLRRLAG